MKECAKRGDGETTFGQLAAVAMNKKKGDWFPEKKSKKNNGAGQASGKGGQKGGKRKQTPAGRRTKKKKCG